MSPSAGVSPRRQAGAPPRHSLPPIRLHDLRHTAVSLLLAQHVPAGEVTEILGHSQIALTMNTYSYVAPELSREAADRTARALQHDEDQRMTAVAARVAAGLSRAHQGHRRKWL